eukprot:403373226
MKSAKEEFLRSMNALKEKKEEYKDLKKFNEEERKRIKIEEKKASSFKFSKMEKKTPFLPAINQKEVFDPFKTNEVGEKYIDSRKKYQMIFPDRALEKNKKFAYTQSATSYFQTPQGQEKDHYDENLKKAMLSGERGLIMTKTKVREPTTGQFKIETQIQHTTAKWDPNNFHPKIITDVKPLLDNSNTPRGAKKAITLERNFDHDVWVYNKSTLHDFSDATKDAKRGKLLAKKIRKQKRSRSKSLGNSYRGSRTGSPLPNKK